ncbi:MAG: hypothetical protein K8R53_13745 [Bacteroidales bacterium]|nr:hypothetical protein [Bacteroidales bacterium]
MNRIKANKRRVNKRKASKKSIGKLKFRIASVKKKSVLTDSVSNVLGGNFLKNRITQQQIPFIFFLTFLALMYIANTYYAEKNIREIEKLQKELKELRYEYISSRSDLMQKSRQSSIANSLNIKGISESTTPPGKLFTSNPEAMR